MKPPSEDLFPQETASPRLFPPAPKSFHRRGRGWAKWIGAGALLPAQVFAASAPTLEHFLPVVIQRGTTNEVTAIGKFEDWPPQFWSDVPGLSFSAPTNKGRLNVVVADDALAGPRLVRVFSPHGASRPRFLIVSEEVQTRETEPNDSMDAPQPIPALPAAINGRLDKRDDVDVFAVHLEAGQTLVASLEAYVLGSPLDAVLRLTDTRGVQLAWNHDRPQNPDPFLAWTAPASGTFLIQVMGFPHPATSDVRLHGGEACVYHLRLSTAPWARHALPLGLQADSLNRRQIAGWNLPHGSGGSLETTIDLTEPSCPLTVFSLRPEGFSNTLALPVGESPERLEREPNGTAAEAEPLEIPGAITGAIGAPGDEDRFVFHAPSGERLWFKVLSQQLGFPLDAWLNIEDMNGRQLARNDDAEQWDPELEWTAPENGRFIVAVGSVLRRPPSDSFYRLAVSRPVPSGRLTVAEPGWVLKPGSTNELKISLERKHGWNGKLDVIPRDLPEGVRGEPVAIGEKEQEGVLKLITATNAAPFNGVFRLDAADGTNRWPVLHEFVRTSVDNGVPQGFRELVVPSTDQLWLTVPPPPAEPQESSAK